MTPGWHARRVLGMRMQRPAVVVALLAFAALALRVLAPEPEVPQVRPRSSRVAPPIVVAPVLSLAPALVAVAAVTSAPVVVRHPEPLAAVGPDPARTLEVVGCVVDPGDAPVPGAEVELRAQFWNDGAGRRLLDRAEFQERLRSDQDVDLEHEVVARAVADLAGRFRLGPVALPAGRFRLGPVALPEDQVGLSLEVYDPATGATALLPSHLRLEAPTPPRADLGLVVVQTDGLGTRRVRLDVEVRDAGRPAPGALVQACWYWDDGEWSTVRTDATGRATFVVPPVEVRLRADGAGLRAERTVPVGAEELELELDLAPVRRLRVAVRGLDGRPVAGASVRAETLPATLPVHDTTDGRGEALLDLGAHPSDWLVVAWTARDEDLLVSAPVRLDRGAWRCELVVSASTWLSARTAAQFERRGDDGEWLRLPSVQDVGGGCGGESLFRVAAPALVRAVGPDGATGPPVELRPGSPRVLALPSSSDGRWVRGRVVAPDGRPLAEVRAVLWAGAWGTSARTESDGTFALRAPAREVEAVIDAGGAAPARLPVREGVTELGDVVVDAPRPRRR